VEHGYMEVVPGTGSIQTREHFGDCQLHVEWSTPAVVEGERDSGNSGVFLMGLYEIQVLDCYQRPCDAPEGPHRRHLWAISALRQRLP
jgi:hypothetical protein